MSREILFIIALSLVFDFLNGVHGSSNIVATMITSRAFRPWTALGLTAAAEFLGPFLFGTAVARTIGSEIVRTNVITAQILVACLVSAILWNLLAWCLGIPSSSSNGLIGGLIGATIGSVGIDGLRLNGLIKVVEALAAAPVIGFGLGFIMTRFIHILVRNSSPRINEFFKSSQVVTALTLAVSHGANDGQKAIGVIVLTLVISGYLPGFSVPSWVVIISAAGMALGTLLAGWRLIRTVGSKFYKIRPVHGFSAQLTSSLILLGSSLAGWPVSATHVISSAIVGVGSSERLGKVRWGVAGEILVAWLLTIPATGVLSAIIYLLLTKISG